MRKYFILAAIASIFAAVSCTKTEDVKTYSVGISLKYDGTAFEQAGVEVGMRTLNGSVTYNALTDESGTAQFNVPAGLYEASAAVSVMDGGSKYVYNGLNSSINVAADAAVYEITLTQSKSSQLIIKELYTGGAPKDDGSGAYINASYVILYNNGDTEVDASNVGIAFASTNSFAMDKYSVNGELLYVTQGWIPATSSVWTFSSPVKIAPYSQIVISIFGAIDHTKTHSQSVDLSNADYVCYDLDNFNMAAKYPTPSPTIPSSNYMKTYKFGAGTAWMLSNTSPAFYILDRENILDFTKDRTNYETSATSASLPDVKIPFEWILDGIEVFAADRIADSYKRFPSFIDNSYFALTSKMGYTAYRNVDKEATEAIAENKGKIVYNYALGTADIAEGSTDPSGIDAEASIKAGAKIVYMDTNNSSKDFHQRAKASIKK